MADRPRCRTAKRDRMRRRLKSVGSPCAICGLPIDYSLRGRDPLSFEWDHGRAHSQGGSDGYENAQAAHRVCNIVKGNGLRYSPAELRSRCRAAVSVLMRGGTMSDATAAARAKPAARDAERRDPECTVEW